MKYSLYFIIFSFFFLPDVFSQTLPYLKKQGNCTQLIINEKPFFILGGELANSSASDAEYMNGIWPKLEAMKLNTVLAPVYWELIEPKENQFDFSLVDHMIENAGKHKIKLVLLWFGSWKNSMSCYVPEWVKKDQKRFPRVKTSSGKTLEILSPFIKENWEADKKAFVALMKHIRETDKNQTVIMIQVENEIGMIENARDMSDIANKLYASEVPSELIQYILKNKKMLIPEFDQYWSKNGYKGKGTWEEVFGKDIYTEEIFQAWHFARYTEEITNAGKSVYNLPMYLNAALNSRGRKPGEYPSAGPLAHLMDIWRAAAPSIDFLSPDIYDKGFENWCTLYDRNNNPFFIPEARRGPQTAAQAFYVFGAHNTIGFSPFSIESTSDPANEPLVKTYNILYQLTPLLSEKQGKNVTAGVLFDEKEHPKKKIQLGEYVFEFAHDYTLGWSPEAKNETWPESGALIIQMAPDEFLVAGTGIVATFQTNTPEKNTAGILSIDEGSYEKGQWTPQRRLNGDENHQGRHLRIPVNQWGIQYLRLYKFFTPYSINFLIPGSSTYRWQSYILHL